MLNIKFIVRGFTVLAGILVVVLVGWRLLNYPKSHHPHSIDQADYGTVPTFQLTNQSGKTIHSKELEHKLWVANFIFTRCAGPCPLITQKTAKLQNEFLNHKDFHLVSFTVDPDYDTPLVLESYAMNYGANKDKWYFLTGNRKDVYKLIRDGFHLSVEGSDPSKHGSHSGSGETFDVLHSMYLVLVGEKNRILGYYNSADSNAIAELKDKIRSHFS